MWIPKLFGKRCVATVHGLDWQREKWKGGFGSKFIHWDDSSTDKTVEVVKAFIFKNGYHNVKIEVGKNMGYAKSFWTALKNCGDADYYAFSDQDDVWKKDKLLKCIAPMEKDKEVGSKLSYCKMNRCSPDLQRLSEQVNVLPPKCSFLLSILS